MKLKHQIDRAIYNYPLLFRAKNYAESRLHVLDQLFLTNGNGYDWHPDGYLVDSEKSKAIRRLPSNYFDINLYGVEVNIDQIPMMRERLKGRYFYVLKDSFNKTKVSINFEAPTLKMAQKLCKGLPPNERTIEIAKIIGRPVPRFPDIYLQSVGHSFKPYPISEFSAASEIFNGRTSGVGCEEFEFTPQQDWLEGCIEVVEAAQRYFNDPAKYVNDNSHPSQKKPQIENALKNERKYELYGKRKAETLDRYLDRIWERHRQKQLDFCEKFLAKFCTVAKGRTRENIFLPI